MPNLSAIQLQAIMPGIPPFKVVTYLPFLTRAMEEAEINTKLRMAAFLAQLGHESYSLKFMEEIWGPTPAQSRYEPVTSLSVKLGNTVPGDGKRYKGRGPIQLTGRSNYRLCGAALGLDLEGKPDLAAQPDVGFRVACWFWKTRDLNTLADAGRFDDITQRINGGQNGADDRRKRYEAAKTALIGMA